MLRRAGNRCWEELKMGRQTLLMSNELGRWGVSFLDYIIVVVVVALQAMFHWCVEWGVSGWLGSSSPSKVSKVMGLDAYTWSMSLLWIKGWTFLRYGLIFVKDLSGKLTKWSSTFSPLKVDVFETFFSSWGPCGISWLLHDILSLASSLYHNYCLPHELLYKYSLHIEL